MSFPLLHPSDGRPLTFSMAREEFAREYVETQHVEFKAGTGHRQIHETATAFANHEGGLVFVGVRDDGTIRGRALDPGTTDDLTRELREIGGSPRFALEELDVEGRAVVVVRVWELEEGFAQTSDGRVLRRNGTRDDALYGTELMRFLAERSGRSGSVERRATRWSSEDADPALVDRMERARGWKDWRSRGLADKVGLVRDGCLTTAGALLLRQDPELELGRAYVELVRFPDDDGQDYDLRRDFRGPIDDQLRSCATVVSELIGFHTAFRGVDRIEIPRLPERVVREVLANAVGHRDYARAGSCISVELRPGSLVVRSPGGLPAGVTTDNLREAQFSRNPTLLESLHQYDLAEQRGRGIDLVEDQMRDAMLDRPRFEDVGDRFDVRLSFASTVTLEERAWVRVLTEQGRLRPGDQVVLVAATRGDQLTNARVQSLLACAERPARAALKRLTDAGLLQRHGDRGSTRYVLAPDHERRVSRGLSSDDVLALVLRLVDEQGTVQNADVRHAAGVDRQEALRAFESLVHRGVLERVGERRGTRYRRVR